MSASSGSPSSSGSEFTYHRPSHRKDFQIAIICALSLEYDAATLIVDEFWDQDGKQFGRTSGDTNIYRNGRIGMHNVVLMLLPNMGKAAVAGSAASLRTSYSNLRIAFLVGVCGGVPMLGAHEALLGDVVIGEAIIQYDFGRQYPGDFITKETAVATQSLPNKDIRTLLAYFKSDTGKTDLRQNASKHLKALQGAAIVKNHQYGYIYPGIDEDKLFIAMYRHKHRGGPSGDSCCESESYCDNAAQSSCSELGCDETKLVHRHRLERKRHLSWEEAQCPDIFIGRVASADTVMKSGDHRDQIAKQHNIIAFEMEGAGLWDECPCIVVKGICDYADSHKNKIWQPFAAATAAAAVKAMLARYTIEDHSQLSTSSAGSTQNGQIVLARHGITHYSAQKPSSRPIPGSTKSNATQTLRDSIFDFQRALTDDQHHELQGIKMVPDTSAVLVFTAELDSLNRNRKGCSIASRLHSVLQSVRDFSAAVEAVDSTHQGIASTLWGSVRLTMLATVKSVTYDETLSKFFMDLGRVCPRWTDYQIFYSSSPQLQGALHDFYASLIRCCKRAVETTQNSWSGYPFNFPQESLDRNFQQDAEDIERLGMYVKDAIAFAKTEAHYQIQQLQSLKKGEGSKKEKRPKVFRGKGGRHDKMESWQTQSDERQAKERKQRLLESLSIHDYLTPFKQSCRKRYSGTLEWLFHTDEFNTWISSREFPLLWCSGKIGSGKTTLSASVIEQLLTKRRSPHVFISFFFVRFDDRQSLNAEVILKSIIRQMLNVSDIYAKVETLLDNMQLNLASGLNEVEKLLQSIAAEFETLYIVIDGLDECTKSERHDLLEALHSVMEVRPNIKLFLAGRDSVSREVQMKFPTLKQIPMDCSSAQSDIATYVEGIVQEKLKTEELIVGECNLIEDIKSALSDGANGMFLWVVFQINELCLQRCDEDIRAAIRNFPKDLEETFNRVIDRIVSRRNEDVAKRIFRWVAAAKEPLSLNQLEEIIFVEIGQEYSRTERRSNGIAHISSWCENLVDVDEELKTVQFVHQTVQQFFIERSLESRRNQFHLNLEDSDHYLGEICVTYLNFNDFKTTLARRWQPLPPMPPIAIAGTALAPKWKAFPSIPTLLKLNLNNKGGSTASNAIEALGSFQRDDTGDAKERLLVGHPFLGYASIHWICHTTMFQKGKSNTWDLWENMIVHGHDLVEKPWIQTSFSDSIPAVLEWSQKARHYGLIRLILLTGMLSALDRGQLMQSAAIHEDITLLDILLEHEKSGIIIDQGCELAVQLGHLNALDRLLAAGADGQNALQGAVRNGDRKVIKRILITGVDGRPLLHIALRDNDLTTARVLLDAGVNGQPLLQAAIEQHDQDIIKLLLAAGVDSQTALQTTAQRGHHDIIKSLLAAGADGQTALLNAANNGHLDAIKALLSAGADGQTALQAAVQRGHQSIITRLLSAGIDGQIALRATTESKDVSATKSLLDAGVNGLPLLQAAIERHSLSTVNTLLAAGADGQALLQTAALDYQQNVIKHLLAAGIDGQTALQAIARSGHVSAAMSLLDAGVDGQIALLAFARNGDVSAATSLLYAGVDGQPLLQAAIEQNDLTYTARALIDAGVDGRPLLRAAARKRDITTTGILLAAGVDGQPLLQAAIEQNDLTYTARALIDAGVDGRPLLRAAARKRDITTTGILLAAGVDGQPLLRAAIKKHRLATAETLLAAGIDGEITLQAIIKDKDISATKSLLKAGVNSQPLLQVAIEKRDLTTAKTLIAAGADGLPLLQTAIQSHDLATAKTLLAAGENGQPLLQAAIEKRDLTTANTLLAVGVNGQPLLQAAIRKRDLITASIFLAVSIVGQPLLHAAIAERDLTTIKLLLAAGANGQPLLQAAIERRDPTTTKILIAAGVDGQPLLQAAIERPDQNVIKLLFAADIDDRLILLAASKSDNQDLVKLQLAAGLNWSRSLQTASQWGYKRIIKILLAIEGESGKSPDYDIPSALYAACRGGHLDVVETLLYAAASMGNDHIQYDYALREASEGGQLNIVERLLAAGSRVNVYRTLNLESALAAASRRGHLAIVERLLAAGAQVNAFCMPGKPTALQAACQGGHLDVVKMLLAAGADVDKNDKSGDILRAASEGGHHLDVLDAFLAAGFKVNLPESSEMLRIALQAASQRGNLEVVERLLGAGADVNVPAGSKAHTALQLAAEGGHRKIVSRLKQAGAKN